MVVLHGHSDYSILDGICKVPDYVAKAKSLGHTALALTDHGTLGGLVDFYFECKKQGIKPIMGCEFYQAGEEKGKYYHLILLAMNKTGFKNLIKLSQIGQDNFYRKPLITAEDVHKHGAGLIGTSACIGGYLQQHWFETARFDKKYLTQMQKHLTGGFYLEVHDNGIPDQERWNRYALDRYPELCVASNDVHFLEQHHEFAHRVALAISYRKRLIKGDETGFPGSGYWFREDFDLPISTQNATDDIAAKVKNYTIGHKEWQLPKVAVPASLHLTLQTKLALTKKDTDVYHDRLDYEFDVIEKNGFLPYFQIVAGIYDRFRKEDRFVGWGRGSTGGSLVAYLMGITKIDPIEWGLIFERFLNPGRVTMPDIDMDFQPQDRQLAMDELSKYGKTFQIGTYGTLSTRECINSVSKALDIKTGLGAYIPAQEPVPTIKELMLTKAFKAQVKKERNERLIDVCMVLEGIKRSKSIHAAGVVLTNDELPTRLSRSGASKGVWSTEWDMYALEKLKYVKFDVLGVKNLELIDIVCDQVGITPEEIPLDDPATFSLIQSGSTVGVFQWESDGYRTLIRKVDPDRFDELLDLNTLYRPGCLESGITDSYIARKSGHEPVTQLHPKLNFQSQGLPLYQEDMLVIAKEVAGFSLSEADVLRKAIGKKEKATFDKMKESFINGCQKHSNLAESKSQALWAKLEASARYTWNKSHAVAYTLISWWTAFLSANHPERFMAELLNQAGTGDRRRVLLSECRRRGIRLEYPDVNQSTEKFEAMEDASGGAIRAGLGGIKYLGEKTLASILQERGENGPFADADELLSRTKATKRHIEYLGYAGALFSPPTDLEKEREALGYNMKERQIDKYWWSAIAPTVGEVIEIHKILTKKGDPMAFLNIEFMDQTLSITVFPGMWSFVKDKVSNGTMAFFKWDGRKVLEEIASLDSYSKMKVAVTMPDEFLSFYPSLIGEPNIYAAGSGIARVEMDEEMLDFINDEFGVTEVWI